MGRGLGGSGEWRGLMGPVSYGSVGSRPVMGGGCQLYPVIMFHSGSERWWVPRGREDWWSEGIEVALVRLGRTQTGFLSLPTH